MLLEEKLELEGIYDPGSQVSLINAKWIKIKNKEADMNKILLKTVNGVNKTNGLVTIKIKIFEIERNIDVYIYSSSF